MQQSSPSDYQSALNFLFEQLPMFSRLGSQALNPSLDKIILLSEHLGHPERKFKSVHIAGTNGKGSTSHILAACFQTAGYKTGLYTSPHLIDIRERVRIDGSLMEKDALLQFLQENWSIISAIKPSYFELNVAMAFWYFAKQEVDIAIIETGMGGRWDSTNIISPELSIITNISLDHTNILGNTVQEIAVEKAGIIKNAVPVLIGESQQDTEATFSKFAILNQTNLRFADLLFDGAITATSAKSQTIKIIDKRDYSIFEINTDLLGSFQVANLITALAATIQLKEQGWQVDIDVFKEAVTQVKTLTGLRGRWEWIQTDPIIIADVGHNPAGLALIAKQLQQDALKNKTKRIILGFVSDKDVVEALSFLPKDAVYYFTKADVPRALAIDALAKIGQELNLKFNTFSMVSEAVAQALKDAKADELLLITGSFFIVGEALAYLNKTQKT